MNHLAALMLARALQDERLAAARHHRVREPEADAPLPRTSRRSWAQILSFPRLHSQPSKG